MAADGKSLICVGHVLGAQGIRGWVRIYSNTSPRENILQYRPWLIERDDEIVAVDVKGRLQGKQVLARLQGIEDRNQAEALIGCRLFIRNEQLPPLAENEYYWSDLIGLRVETIDAEPLGEIASMMETGADDVMVVRGDRERLIPFVLNDIVTEVDLRNRRLVVDWSPEFET